MVVDHPGQLYNLLLVGWCNTYWPCVQRCQQLCRGGHPDVHLNRVGGHAGAGCGAGTTGVGIPVVARVSEQRVRAGELHLQASAGELLTGLVLRSRGEQADHLCRPQLLPELLLRQHGDELRSGLLRQCGADLFRGANLLFNSCLPRQLRLDPNLLQEQLRRSHLHQLRPASAN
jgi:hypothetical protein